ncbi:MAG TPA: VOC family protein [Xanthobacteraceae bacterium]|jgi:PhnB protein|nr:VOC family protein [Xanthobacteraceae bacterium]
MQVQPYLFFDGRADEAIEFYKKAVGATPRMLMRFKDAPDQSMITPESKDKVMHAAVDIGDTTVLISDGHCAGQMEFKGFSLAYSARNESEADKVFGALSDGGKVTMPLAKTFFSPRFGMLTDKFGVGWMILVPQ